MMVSVNMEQVIRERRTIREIVPAEISLAEIEKILTAAAFAPFHSSHEPWRAYSIVGREQHVAYVEEVLQSYQRGNVWQRFKAAEVPTLEARTRDYFQQIPVSLIITCCQKGQEKADYEAVLATAALIQNIQLLAWEAGIGVTWRTTANIFDATFQEKLQISENEKIVGTLHFTKIGAKVPKAKRRQPLREWLKPLAVEGAAYDQQS